MHNLMLRPTCSPFGSRNPIVLANLKIFGRFYQILSYRLTLNVTSPPKLMRSFDAYTNTLTTYWRNRKFIKERNFHYGTLKKIRSFFKGLEAGVASF